MSFTLLLIVSISITVLVYFGFIGAFKVGGWMARNENRNKRIVKILDKILTYAFRGFMLFLIWAMVIQLLSTLGYVDIVYNIGN